MLLMLRKQGCGDASSATGPQKMRQDARVPLNRLAWLVTVMAALITALLLFLSGYNGYGALAIAVGACAAINLR
jgi:ABC-type Na+ efflux pump permease subunit